MLGFLTAPRIILLLQLSFVLVVFASRLNIADVPEQLGGEDVGGHGDPQQKQSVLFIRHGESEYNKAGFIKHIPLLSRGYIDAPLTQVGVQQALKVAAQLSDMLEGGAIGSAPHELREMAMPDCIFSSPLTRALQTCLLALAPILRRRPQLIVTLDPDLRETVDKMHWDSVGKATGTLIMDQAVDKMQQTLNDAPEEIRGEFSRWWSDDWQTTWRRMVNASQAEANWWSDAAESDKVVKERAAMFVRGLRGRPACRRSIVVGHSAAIRALFQTHWEVDAASYVPQWFRGSSASWNLAIQSGSANMQPAEDLTKRKLSNVGLASMSLAGPPESSRLHEARLLLDTHIEGASRKTCDAGRGSLVGTLCACRWGLECKSPKRQCGEGIGAWSGTDAVNLFAAACKDCTCSSS